MNTNKLFLRILVLPLVVPMLLIFYLHLAIKKSLDFFLYGGEVITLTKGSKATIENIYYELRRQRERRASNCALAPGCEIWEKDGCDAVSCGNWRRKVK